MTIDTDGTLRDNITWRPEPEPKDLKDYATPDGKEVFKKLLKFYQRHMIYQKPIEHIVDTLYSMSTYHMDKFDSIKYLGYFGSGNEKGKSTALRIHRFVDYRACPISSGTDPAFRWLLENGATLLLDQAEELFFEGNYKKKTFMYKCFLSGYQRDWLHVQMNSENKNEIDCRHLYGAKIYNMQDDGNIPDNALKSRTYAHHMIQGRPEVVNMLRNEESMQSLDWIFKTLHYLRLQKYKELNYDTGLFGRTRELWEPDINMIELYNLPYWVEKRIYSTAFEHMDTSRDTAQDTLPAEIYYGLLDVSRNLKEFTASHIKSYLIQTYPNKYAKGRYADGTGIYEGTIGKYLHDLMGLKNKMVNHQRVYDISDPLNQEIINTFANQYSQLNSIEIQCLVWEKDNGVEVDTAKSVYERWADYMQYRKMMDLAKDISSKAITSQQPIKENEPDWAEQEIEYPCPNCRNVIVGIDPRMMCDDCENKVKQWEIDHSRPDPLDPLSNE